MGDLHLLFFASFPGALSCGSDSATQATSLARECAAGAPQSKRTHFGPVGPGQPRADAVEKVRRIPLTRNNRIIGVDFLNRTCAFEAHFESILLRDPPKIFFRQHRPIADNRGPFGDAGNRIAFNRKLPTGRSSVISSSVNALPKFKVDIRARCR